jgi:hypothetical protein
MKAAAVVAMASWSNTVAAKRAQLWDNARVLPPARAIRAAMFALKSYFWS